MIFKINGVEIEFDESLEYAEFFTNNGKPDALEIDMKNILTKLENGMDFERVHSMLYLLSRWVFEAPRKRFFRNMRREGGHVLSSEYFFEQDGGDKFIDALENSSKVAVKVLDAFGKKSMEEVKNDVPTPVPMEQMLKGRSE